jgi:hypothetical protein
VYRHVGRVAGQVSRNRLPKQSFSMNSTTVNPLYKNTQKLPGVHSSSHSFIQWLLRTEGGKLHRGRIAEGASLTYQSGQERV